MSRYFPLHTKDAERLIGLTVRQARNRHGHDLLAFCDPRSTRALMSRMKLFPEDEIVCPDGNKILWNSQEKEWYYLEY
jgi:hypothetical protein